MQDRHALASLALAASILVGVAAAAAPADAQHASFCGPVRFTGRSCVTVPGSRGSTGQVFDIGSATPPPRRNAMISGSGTVRGISRCTQASARLAQVSWRRVTACPQAG